MIKRLQPYFTGAIIVAVLLILRLVLPLVLPDTAGQTAKFLTIFLAILLTFVFFILFVGRQLHGRVPARVFSIIEVILIIGILGGVVAMFQPWTMFGYKLGFQIVLASTLAFTVWSHIVPRGAREEEEELTTVSVGELEEGY
ncbi:MAG: hypothetical protein H8D78_11515 [Chloroflexi bacterium]|nr:hypothetical protein [Chloroflexota bacterium]